MESLFQKSEILVRNHSFLYEELAYALRNVESLTQIPASVFSFSQQFPSLAQVCDLCLPILQPFQFKHTYIFSFIIIFGAAV